MNSSKTSRYLAIGPSPQSSNVLLCKPLLMTLYLLELDSDQQWVLLHKHNISVKRKTSTKRPGSRLSCFLCSVQQVLGKKLVVALVVKSSLQSSVRINSHSILDSSRT